MADDMMTIRVRITGDPQGAKKVKRQIEDISKQSGIASVQVDKFSKSTGGLRSNLTAWQKQNKLLTGGISGLIGALGKLGKFTVKFGAIGFAGILAGLSALSAAFKLGSWIAKAYQVAMAGLAAGVASAAAAFAVFTAAQREMTAATNAFANKSAPALGSQLNQSRAALRNLQADSQLGAVGIKGLTAAFTAFSKYGSFNANTQRSLQALDDFASAGGDRAKGLTAAAELLGKVQKAIGEGKTGLTADIESAGKQLGPTFEKALKEWKKKNKTQTLTGLQSSINSGEFAKLGGVEGQAAAVNSTLISQVKAFVTQIQVFFADLGQPLLGPVKKAFFDISKILRTTLLRVAGDIEAFAEGSVLNTLVSAFEKLSNFFVKLMREYLPKSQGMLKGFGDWWGKFVYMWKELTGKLDSAAAAGKKINKMFGGILAYAFKRLSDMIKKTTDLINQNPEKFEALQRTVEKILNGISSLYQFFVQTFIDAAPAIESVVNLFINLVSVVGMLFPMIKSLGNALGGEGNGFGSLLQLVTMIAGGALAKKMWTGTGGGKGGSLIGGGLNFLFGMGGGKGGAGGAGGAGGGGGLIGGGLYNRGKAKATSIFTNPFGKTNAAGGVGNVPYGPTVGGAGTSIFTNPFSSRAAAAQGKPGMGGAFSRGYNRNRAQGGGVGSSLKRGASGAAKSGARSMGGGKGLMRGGGGMGGVLGGMAFQALGSKFLDESAQSGVQVGSSMMMMGLPPGLAIGAGLGTAAFKAKTAGGGALLGAGSGAALGMMAGGPVGAAIGAVVGGIAGAIKGAWNKDKAERKKAKESAKQLVMEHASAVLTGMTLGGKGAEQSLKAMSSKTALYGQFDGLNQRERKAKAASMGLTGADLENVTQEHFGTYYKELKSNSDDLNAAARGPMANYKNRMKELMQLTGKTEPELHKLSMEMGVNLYDSSIDLASAMKGLGQTVDLTKDGIVNASKDLAIEAMGAFDKAFEKSNAPNIIDEAAEKLRQLGQNANEADFIEFYKTAYEQLQIMNPEASQFEINDLMKKSFGEGGTAYSQAGGPLAGLGALAKSTGGMGVLNTVLNNDAESQKKLLGSQIAGRLAESNLSADMSGIQTQLSGMSTEQLTAIQKSLYSGTLSRNIVGVPKAGGADVMGEKALAGLGITAEVSKMAVTVEEKLNENATLLREQLVAGVTEGFSKQPDWYNTSPAWYNKESFEALIGDTSSPRGGRVGDTSTSRTLGRTMRRHGYLDSMVTGSRSVTSSYRTYGLGSSNSDHVTGRAYDLTGQNLGAYKTAVDSMGGFAEFHGVSANRHLHVVPGQSPVGDMTAPRMPSASAPQSYGGGGGDAITVNVYGAQGQDETVIAQKVASLLDKRARSTRERL